MKKTIQKPENWQDFENLCKKLWGEIWSIPSKIKKNGRSGQPQAGVDIYGIPSGEVQYWGIQCKGKDDYTKSKLTEAEIEIEIEKAQSFKPELAVFILATSMNKDASIEEYVRLKDIQSRSVGGFEILLFCWEDIADMIDENADTYNYYVAGVQHKTKYNFKVSLNDFSERFVLRPKCIRKLRKYRMDTVTTLPHIMTDERVLSSLRNNRTLNDQIASIAARLNPVRQRINEAICSFEVIMENIGATVIEDWRVKIEIAGSYIELMDTVGSGPMGIVDIGSLKYKQTYVKDNVIRYSPYEDKPLIQKDNRYFKAYIIPECREYSIPVKWELLARDYHANGEVFFDVEPEYEDVFDIVYVSNTDELKPDELISVSPKKNYE